MEACLKALDARELECIQMPHSETIRMMKIMDAIREQWGIVYPFEKDEVEAKIPEKSEEIVTEQLPAEKEETVAETVETDAENAGETEQVESTEVLKESVEAVLSESATTEAAESKN